MINLIIDKDTCGIKVKGTSDLVTAEAVIAYIGLAEIVSDTMNMSKEQAAIFIMQKGNELMSRMKTDDKQV